MTAATKSTFTQFQHSYVHEIHQLPVSLNTAQIKTQFSQQLIMNYLLAQSV